jgi:hypothetical protein
MEKSYIETMNLIHEENLHYHSKINLSVHPIDSNELNWFYSHGISSLKKSISHRCEMFLLKCQVIFDMVY